MGNPVYMYEAISTIPVDMYENNGCFPKLPDTASKLFLILTVVSVNTMAADALAPF